MRIACGVFRMVYIIYPRKSDITVADQNSSVLKTAGRVVADCIAELMTVQGTVNKIVGSVKFPHGACLKKCMSFIWSSFGLLLSCHANVTRTFFYSEHI